jgi:CheY-like chemotaxis protein
MTSLPTRIIIVEDDDIYRSALKSLINSRGHFQVVAEGETSKHALEVAQRYPADLLLADLRMPMSRRYDLLRKIKTISSIKILVLTDFKSYQDMREALDAGANGYCFKDVSRAEIIEAIERTLSGDSYVCRTTVKYPDDKRSYDRLQSECQVSWSYFDQKSFSAGRVLNCSRVGCYLETREAVFAGSKIHMRLDYCIDCSPIPKDMDHKRLNIVGEPKWCQASRNSLYSVGVKYQFPFWRS